MNKGIDKGSANGEVTNETKIVSNINQEGVQDNENQFNVIWIVPYDLNS